jgi:hypothetical protein
MLPGIFTMQINTFCSAENRFWNAYSEGTYADNFEELSRLLIINELAEFNKIVFLFKNGKGIIDQKTISGSTCDLMEVLPLKEGCVTINKIC